MAGNAREHQGWILHESGPSDAAHTVLLLPGGMCTAVFYDDLVAERALGEVSLRLVVTAVPGHGGTPEPADLSLEHYGRMAVELVRDLGCDVVVGHSLGANVAIEMARTGGFAGPLVLLSPSFSREDESRFLRVMDQMATVSGQLPFRFMLAMIGPALKNVKVSAERRNVLVGELKKNDAGFVRQAIRSYFEYLQRHGTLAPALCRSGAPAWVVFGERDDVGLRDDERAVLESCPTVSLRVVRDAGHLTLNEQPAVVAGIVSEAVGRLPG
ncbi:hypothetical protein GCM10009844_18670 [Nocardioides koreensis]|uniref:AB hydrolase-1 domain-containing protein n=1 Tax=Nocardioides koreensis TaxID=433651 RepID=A0ABP5LBQ8_9ACTN